MVLDVDAVPLTEMSASGSGLQSQRSGHIREALIVAIAWIVGQLEFFRAQWFSGFNKIMGDPGAARFIIYINENWYQSLLGRASWRNPAFYYPIKNTLGLSDTLLLWQIVYAPARALGADPFLAFQIVLVASSAIGFVTFYMLLRTVWRPPVALGVLGSFLFTFSNALYLNANHPQLFGVLLVPSVCLLGIKAWRSAERGSLVGILWGVGFSALGVLVVYSTYYAGYFALLAAVVAAVLTFLFAPRATLSSVSSVFRSGWFVVIGVVAGAVPPAILFAITFLPALHSSGGYNLATAFYFRANFSDLVNVGSGNLLWGSSIVLGAVHGLAAQSERDYAVTPILLLLSLGAAIWATVRERRDAAPPGGRRFVPAVLTSTGVLLILAPIAIGNTFLWNAVFWIPGASGIRAIDRISLVACGVFVLALVSSFVSLVPRIRIAVPKRSLMVGFSVVALLLCLEQVNVSNSSQMTRSVQVALLDQYHAPPSQCQSFFVETATASLAHPARPQVTAMLLSERFDIPTLNGTSGSSPTGWHLRFPTLPGYTNDVSHWVSVRHVSSTVCALNLDTAMWSVFTPSTTPATAN
jgi:hypothetical protein